MRSRSATNTSRDSIAIIDIVASLLIRQLDEGVKERLRLRAAAHGQSMEAEARDILKIAVFTENTKEHWSERFRRPFQEAGVFMDDVEFPPREIEDPTQIFRFDLEDE